MTLTSNSNVNFGYQETTLTKFNNMVQQRTCQKSSTLNCSDSRIHQRLGQLVNALTEDLGSERKLGRITDISHVGLRKWSLCKADPKLQNLIQFAYSLGWSLTVLSSEAWDLPYKVTTFAIQREICRLFFLGFFRYQGLRSRR